MPCFQTGMPFNAEITGSRGRTGQGAANTVVGSSGTGEAGRIVRPASNPPGPMPGIPEPEEKSADKSFGPFDKQVSGSYIEETMI